MYQHCYTLTFTPRVEEQVDGVWVAVAEYRVLVVDLLDDVDLELPLAHVAVGGCVDGQVQGVPGLFGDPRSPLLRFVFVG